jgi:hypothetical protein
VVPFVNAIEELWYKISFYQKSFAVASSLNGNNGEWTNTDDLDKSGLDSALCQLKGVNMANTGCKPRSKIQGKIRGVGRQNIDKPSAPTQNIATKNNTKKKSNKEWESIKDTVRSPRIIDKFSEWNDKVTYKNNETSYINIATSAVMSPDDYSKVYSVYVEDRNTSTKNLLEQARNNISYTNNKDMLNLKFSELNGKMEIETLKNVTNQNIELAKNENLLTIERLKNESVINKLSISERIATSKILKETEELQMMRDSNIANREIARLDGEENVLIWKSKSTAMEHRRKFHENQRMIFEMEMFDEHDLEEIVKINKIKRNVETLELQVKRNDLFRLINPSPNPVIVLEKAILYFHNPVKRTWMEFFFGVPEVLSCRVGESYELHNFTDYDVSRLMVEVCGINPSDQKTAKNGLPAVWSDIGNAFYWVTGMLQVAADRHYLRKEGFDHAQIVVIDTTMLNRILHERTSHEVDSKFIRTLSGIYAQDFKHLNRNSTGHTEGMLDPIDNIFHNTILVANQLLAWRQYRYKMSIPKSLQNVDNTIEALRKNATLRTSKEPP